MISEKVFTLEEFHEKVKDFAQAMVNKINDVNVNAELRQEGPASYLLNLIKKNGAEHYSIFLNANGNVETMSVYNV